jgi:hypothetical protein
MSPRRRVADDRAPWTYTFGVKPYVLTAYERSERGHQLIVRWTDPESQDPRRPGKHKRHKRGLSLSVRDPDTGRLDHKLVRAAQLAVQQLHARLVTGFETRVAPPLAARPTAATLTLAEGFRLALDETRGKYPSTATRRYDDMVKYDERLFGKKPGNRALINPDLAWGALQLRDIRSLWRTMADRYVQSEGEEFGLRVAEQIVDAVFSVASWLREENRIPSDAARPPDRWRKRLKEEWELRTGEQLRKPHRPRHTEEEFRQIFAAISDSRVDPRIRLAIEIAAECRTGQVLRCTRRMLTLTEVESSTYETQAAGSLGQVVIPGAGKKHGETVVLTPEQRRTVDDALAGYLSKYEAAWTAGDIEDYYLFPGSKMRALDATGRRWIRRVRQGAKPMSRDGARVAFKELEAIAKVEHMKGRGWYGLRRQAADMAETATTDDRVKDRLGGWQDSETRKSIYQDRETDALRAEAANVRRELRTGRRISGPRPHTAPGEARLLSQGRQSDGDELELLLQGLTATQRAELRARLVNEMPTAMSRSTRHCRKR